MRTTAAAIVALSVLLITSSVGAVAATPSETEPAIVDRASSTVSPLAVEQPRSISAQSTAPPSERPDTRQVIRIQIADNGNAVWRIESRFLIHNETDADAFEAYADAVVSGDRDSPYQPHLFEQYVALTAESTGREMTIENAGWDEPRIVRRQADVESQADDDARIGIISYSFVSTNFATVDGDRLHVGDALRTTNASLLSGLIDGQRLVIEPPENYGFIDTPTSTENGALVWDGPHRFAEDGLEITILRGATSGPGDPDEPSSPLLSKADWILAAAFAIVVIVGGTILVQRRRETSLLPSEWLSSASLTALLERLEQSGSENAADGPGGGTSAVERNTGSEPSPASDESTAGSESGTSLEFEESTDDVDPELLSDEERVLRLLKRNGGRMKQASIVSETGWSNAKVSQLLSKMDDDEEIEKLRIGRENLITLPGVDPTEID